MPFHKDRVYVLAMPPGKECDRRGLAEAFGEEPAQAFWRAWHEDLLPPLFTDDSVDVRLAYGPRTAMRYYRPLVQRPGQLCFVPARNLAARWGRMVEIGLAATDKVIVAASDVPELSLDLIHDVLSTLDDTDLVIGRERDTRFWFLAQRTWEPKLWEYDFGDGPPLPGFADYAKELGLSVAIEGNAEDLDGPDVMRDLRGRLDAARFPKTLAALDAMGL